MKCPKCGKSNFVQQSEQRPIPHKVYVCLDCGYKEIPVDKEQTVEAKETGVKQ